MTSMRAVVQDHCGQGGRRTLSGFPRFLGYMARSRFDRHLDGSWFETMEKRNAMEILRGA